jgi:tetratricopeptide (TPR) repeat protein
VIELGDYLSQPHGNVGLALLMQQKYDEAEAAFKRALEIEPDYDLAQRNLAIRQSGHIPKFSLRDPMAEAKIGLAVNWPSFLLVRK